MSVTGTEALGVFAGVAAAGLAAWWVGRLWVRWRGTRVITCPDNHRPAAVEVDVAGAVKTGLLGRPALHLADCSRWPEKRDCGQECLAQVAAAPEDCLVRHILARFYEGKVCVRCGHAFATIEWHDHKPAVRGTDGLTRGWDEIPAAAVPDALATGEPVCWNCHVALAFRREHPELVTERPYPHA